MSDILEARLCIDEKPFTNTGGDYLGPYHIKLSKRTRSNQATAKRYVALFTCLTTRAVHLEIAGDLSTDAFILALRRFISRRGKHNKVRQRDKFCWCLKRVKASHKKKLTKTQLTNIS